MRRHWMMAGPVLVLILALNTATAGKNADLIVQDAWIRAMPPGMAMTAGYMELRNNSTETQILEAASSPAYSTVEIHRATVDARDGMSGMDHVPEIRLAPNASLIFSPGGYHLMLISPKDTLNAGDRVVVNLKFRSGLELPVEFSIRK